MSLKYSKRIFITIIILLIIAGIYIIYIKDNGNSGNVQAQNRETKITREILIGITDFDTINPILTKNLEIQHLTKLIYEPLINITKDFNTEPGIAEECSKIDELTYIIKLDENKKWENGNNVRVEDIQFTLSKIEEEDTIYKENVAKIKNIEKIDETTFKIHLKEPVDFFEYLLCFPIVEESTYSEQIPRGIGEYKITELNEKQIIIENENTKLIVKIYRNTTELYNEFAKENIDLIVTKNAKYEDYIGNIGFEETIIVGRKYYYISCENIKDKNTRKAINYNINKEKLIYDLYNRKYILADFPLDYGSYLNKTKLAQEEEIKINAGEFTLSTSKENNAIAEKIKEQMAEKGIKIYIQNYQNANADLILKTETVAITPDITKYFEDENIKERLQEISKIENKEVLKEEYGKIIDIYYEELPFISLYFDSYIILHNNKLKGDFSGNWYNMFYNVDTWYKIL